MPSAAFAAISDWQRGGTIVPQSTTDFSGDAFKQSIRNLQNDHANYVTLVVPFQQSNIYSTDIATTWNTPTNDSLAAAIDYVHSLGLKVNLKVQMYPQDGQWSALINPSDRQSWFSNYRSVVLLPLSAIASQHKVEEFTIGSELCAMTMPSSNGTNSANWRSLIGTVRGAYTGMLTYNAQHDSPDEKGSIDFWDTLDIIGISAYHPSGLSQQNPSVDQLQTVWQDWNTNALQPLEQRFHKPLFFSEIGFRSVDGASQQPGAWWIGGNYNVSEQSNEYQAVFQTFQNDPNFRGLQLWNWQMNSGAGGDGNTDYTPQNKPAEKVIQTFFSSQQTSSSSSSASSVPPSTSFTVSASMPSSGSAGQAVAGTVTATNTSGTNTSGIIVDVEMYNAAGSRVSQQVFDNQTFTSGQVRSFGISWTPPANGTYTAKIGVFANAWSTLLFWNDRAAVLQAGAASSSSSSSSSTSSSSNSSSSSSSASARTLNIWWPADGSHLSGVQPFKVQLSNTDISQYRAFWQVDGDQWNAMADSAADYPHKESLVDLRSWNWHGPNGSYALTFIARDLAGNEIARRSISIVVVH